MARQGIGIILLVVAAVIVVALVAGGGPLIPHIVGPIALSVIGLILLMNNRKSSRSAQ